MPSFFGQSNINLLKLSTGLLLSLLAMVVRPTQQAMSQENLSGPQATVDKVITDVRAALSSSTTSQNDAEVDTKLHNTISPAFDFEEMSKRCLGANWSTANAAEQDEFVKLFSGLLFRTYLAKIRNNIVKSEVQFKGEKIADDNGLVKTRVLSPEGNISIDYKMKRDQFGWRVYDVVIENIGLIGNYRTEFAGIIRKVGMPGLLQQLRAKSTHGNEVKAK